MIFDKLMNHFKTSFNKNNKEKDCGTCTDFQDWLNQSKTSKKTDEVKKVEVKFNESTAEASYMDECPLLRNQYGKIAWSYLHTMAAYYPDTPSDSEKKLMSGFIDGFAQFFPCKECAEDFKEE